MNNEQMEALKEDAKKLWMLLDDIDSSSDIFRPEQTAFYKHVMNLCEKRWATSISKLIPSHDENGHMQRNGSPEEQE